MKAIAVTLTVSLIFMLSGMLAVDIVEFYAKHGFWPGTGMLLFVIAVSFAFAWAQKKISEDSK